MKRVVYRREKPVIYLICEGKNMTERKYFNNFKNRDNKFNLYIENSDSDPIHMFKQAENIIQREELDSKRGDKVFWLIDLDLSEERLNKLNVFSKKKSKKCDINIILSNPCFEIWLLYHFTKNPKIVTSSKLVKELMKEYVPNYRESMDIFDLYHLENKIETAIKNSIEKNKSYNDKSVIEKNPYTEVQNLIEFLLSLNDDK